MNISRYTLAYLLGTMIGWGAMLQAAEPITASPQKEKELLAILQSDVPPGEKAIACKKLAIDGSSASVGELAKLLPDAQLSSWARIALESIPGPEADAALREAAAKLQGNLQIGMINSLGVRRDAKSVDYLATKLQDGDLELVTAAAVALGRIGNLPAAKALRTAFATAADKPRSAIAEGCVYCGEKLLAAGEVGPATEMYDAVRIAKVAKPRLLEATRGAILARREQGVPLLIESLRSDDKAVLHVALSTAREIPGAAVDQAIAAELATAKPDRAALLIQAMADRPQTVVLAAIVKAAGEGSKEVRLSALEAMGRVGNASCLSVLLQAAADADPSIAQTAQATLADLPGKEVNAQIAASLATAQGKQLLILIELLGRRRIEASATLIQALNNADENIRKAALGALGETVDIAGLPGLISQVVAPKHVEDLPTAEKALLTACVRMPDREACAAELIKAMAAQKSVATQAKLLQIIGAVGGAKALASIHAAGKGNEPELQDVATKVLGEWMTEDAAPVLIDLAKTAPGVKYQTRALRGYIRITRQFVQAEPQRLEMCRQAWEVAQPAERKLVLEILQRIPSAESLQMAINAQAVPEVKTEANATILVIAQKAGGKDPRVTELLSKAGFEKVKLEIVKAEYGADGHQRDVTALLRKQAGDLPLITLPNKGGFNGNFGGDPAPDRVKQLKIQYKINGKSAEAVFAEDTLIALPMP
jgi:HEAT repeat protein